MRPTKITMAANNGQPPFSIQARVLASNWLLNAIETTPSHPQNNNGKKKCFSFIWGLWSELSAKSTSLTGVLAAKTNTDQRGGVTEHTRKEHAEVSFLQGDEYLLLFPVACIFFFKLPSCASRNSSRDVYQASQPSIPQLPDRIGTQTGQ